MIASVEAYKNYIKFRFIKLSLKPQRKT